MKRTEIQRKTELRRTGGPKRTSGPKPKRRSAKEFARVYGSQERAQRIKAMPCTVPHCHRSPRHNAHTEGGGMGRKAGFASIVPLCGHHHYELDSVLGSVDAFDRAFGTDLRATAARLAEEIPA